MECILQADVSWSDPGGDGTGGGAGDEGRRRRRRWTPDPFENCPAFDLCALGQYRGKHGQLCDERRAREGGGRR